MKGKSLRLKLISFFSFALLIVMALAFFIAVTLGWTYFQKSIRNDLTYAVESNADEVKYSSSWTVLMNDSNTDQYINYLGGWLEIDDDYLNLVNGIYTALYSPDGELLYGENPIVDETENLPFCDGVVMRTDSRAFYVYDRMLTKQGVNGLWLRGVVSVREGIEPLSNTVRMSLILLPLLVAFSIGGGAFLVSRALVPVRHISDTLSRINGGSDLKARLTTDASKDEFGQISRTINQMLSRLDASFETERQFSSDVSHELRTPMAVISAQCDAALEGEQTRETYQKSLRVIRRQLKYMTSLVGDMLDLMRMENGKGRERFEKIDLSALLLQISEDLALMEDKGISLYHDVQAGILVHADPVLVRRLVMNLISNAYRYGRENGHISLTLARFDGECRLSVRDDGIGIAPEHVEKVFDRFYQVSPARTGQSTGLGLSMVRQIALLHGGDVTVESEPDTGSVFTVTLPCADGE